VAAVFPGNCIFLDHGFRDTDVFFEDKIAAPERKSAANCFPHHLHGNDHIIEIYGRCLKHPAVYCYLPCEIFSSAQYQT
jgi:hypothetical protein